MNSLYSKKTIVKDLLTSSFGHEPKLCRSESFKPTNIALCKYWGKRDLQLNLPLSDSLSVTLPFLGSRTCLEVIDSSLDLVYYDQQLLPHSDNFSQRVINFIELFRSPKAQWRLKVTTKNNIPTAAGLASSASGFAALVCAIKDLFQWTLPEESLSILARLGSGSACRSLWHGFVTWQAGVRADGLDSYGMPLMEKWPGLMLGLLIFHQKAKPISSREAMNRCVKNSTLYQSWPKQAAQDFKRLKQAIKDKSFTELGATSEHNALSMHATMLSAWPPICYSSTQTWQAIEKIWQLRQGGLNIYFTQDAGPHLKLLFLEEDLVEVKKQFPELIVVQPFKNLGADTVASV